MSAKEELEFKKIELPSLNFLKDNFFKKLLIIVGALAVLAFLLNGFLFYQYKQVESQLKNVKATTAAGQKSDPTQGDVKKLVAEVGRFIDLPSDEEPTVATITNIEKLKNQPLFQNAKNGDKVLIYTKAKKAIIYDAIRGKIIDVSSVTLDASGLPKGTKLVLRNGTSVSNLATKVETEIKDRFPELEIVSKSNATKNDYDKSVMVVLNKDLQKEAQKFADQLKIEVGGLPLDEIKPKEGDLVIILGKDRI